MEFVVILTLDNYADEVCNITRKQLMDRSTYHYLNRVWASDLTGCIIRSCFFDRLFDTADKCRVLTRKRSGLDFEQGIKDDFIAKGFDFEPRLPEAVVKVVFGIPGSKTEEIDYPFNGVPDFFHSQRRINVEVKVTRHEIKTIPFIITAHLAFLQKIGLVHPFMQIIGKITPMEFFTRIPVFINDLFQLSIYQRFLGGKIDSFFVYVASDQVKTTPNVAALLPDIYDSMITDRLRLAVTALRMASRNPTPVNLLFDALKLWKMELNSPIGMMNSNFCNSCPYRFTHCPSLPPIRAPKKEDLSRLQGIENFLNNLIALEESGLKKQTKDFGLVAMKMLSLDLPSARDLDEMVNFVNRLRIMFTPDAVLPNRIISKLEVVYS
jgi:hypothetical protein